MEKETIAPKDFNLSKVKLLPTGGVNVEYQLTRVIENEASVLERKETCSRDVHPDLRALFDDLRSIVARVVGMTSFLTLLETDEFKKVPESVKNVAREYAIGLLDRIDVRGVAWSGTEDNEGVVVTAVLETPNGLKTCVNTPRIKLAQISFGFEEELETIVDRIKEEVFAYLYKGKQAQLSLFGESEEDTDPFPGDQE